MDMFLLFVVIFLCVMFGLGVGALALSLLFKLILKISPRGAPALIRSASASKLRWVCIPSWRNSGGSACRRRGSTSTAAAMPEARAAFSAAARSSTPSP